MGDRLRIQESILITRNGKRLLRTEYAGETPNGILLRLFFEPGPFTEDKKWDYNIFVGWPSIFCGDVRLKTYDGRDVHAERVPV